MSLSWNADDVGSTNLYKYCADGSWPGIDGVTQSYYQYELGKFVLYVYTFKTQLNTIIISFSRRKPDWSLKVVNMESS